MSKGYTYIEPVILPELSKTTLPIQKIPTPMHDQIKTFHFTAARLIEILKSYPPDMPVVVSGYESGYENFYQPQIMKLCHHPENKYWDGQFQPAEPGDKNTFEAIVLERELRSD